MAKPIFAIIQSDNTRNSLHSVVRGVEPRASFRALKSIAQTIDECLNSEERAGTLFIEFGFSLDELSLGLDKLKANPEKKPDKIILLVGEDSLKETMISDYLNLGFSGILSKPFSENSLNEVFKVSNKLSVKGSIARLKVVTGLQIKSMMEQNGDKFEGSSILKAVKNACKKFEKENPGRKVEDIAEEYSKMDFNARRKTNIKDIYKGASERVRKLVESKDK